MEINVTRFFNGADASQFSASAAELGANAGRLTWRNALIEANCNPILVTPEEIAALRDYVREFGAWEDDKIDGWSNEECNALFFQLISGDIRELESLAMGDDGEVDWQEARLLAEQGCIGGNLYLGDDGCVYFYLDT
jgi:hypothetical protein